MLHIHLNPSCCIPGPKFSCNMSVQECAVFTEKQSRLHAYLVTFCRRDTAASFVSFLAPDKNRGRVFQALVFPLAPSPPPPLCRAAAVITVPLSSPAASNAWRGAASCAAIANVAPLSPSLSFRRRRRPIRLLWVSSAARGTGRDGGRSPRGGTGPVCRLLPPLTDAVSG